MNHQVDPGITVLPWNPEWSETAWDAAWNERLGGLEFDVIVEKPHSSAENCALDAMFLSRVARGARGPVMWFWEWSEPAIILGSYQSVRNEIDSDSARDHGFTFARRMSGGGAMIVEPRRTITFSLIVPEAVVAGMSLRQSFAFLDAWCVRSLRSLGVPARYRPINDIVVPSGKIAGAAQCRRRKTVLHHVTMAYALRDDLVFSLLRLDRPRLSEKGIPSAVKHVSALDHYTGLTYDRAREFLVNAFRSMFRTHDSVLQPDEREEAEMLRRAKFSAPDWLYRVE